MIQGLTEVGSSQEDRSKPFYDLIYQFGVPSEPGFANEGQVSICSNFHKSRCLWNSLLKESVSSNTSNYLPKCVPVSHGYSLSILI